MTKSVFLNPLFPFPFHSVKCFGCFLFFLFFIFRVAKPIIYNVFFIYSFILSRPRIVNFHFYTIFNSTQNIQ
ncbi:hypothetical protein BDF14DRAFT_1790168 [Spinellus fusiger]|nr:hypothetical protein BDF14DRAFT_1790168 [Spinellus fusiger]